MFLFALNLRKIFGNDPKFNIYSEKRCYWQLVRANLDDEHMWKWVDLGALAGVLVDVANARERV